MISRLAPKSCLGTFICLTILSLPVGAVAQYNLWLSVDCSGNDPYSYPSISAAMSSVTDRTAILVASGSVCNEQVYLNDLNEVAIMTELGKTFNLAGNLTIQNSRAVYIYGVNVTNVAGDGININHSTAVTLDDSASSNNASIGLNISSSDVTVNHTGSFDYNAHGGVIAGSNSSLSFSAWWPPTGGHFELIGNVGFGLDMDRSVVAFSGNTTISNTVPSVGGAFPDAFGIVAWGGATGGLFDMTGPNVVTNNQGGGIFLAETSELSMGGGQAWAPYPLTIQGNGPYGVYVEFGAQLTIFGGTQIFDHTIAGVDLYSNSQAAIFGANQITHNGTGLDPARAGLRVDGNSQAYVRGATFSQNGGPGILELVNSSVDLAGATFVSNIGGSVVCDGSAVVKSDLTSTALGSGNTCRIAPASGTQRLTSPKPQLSGGQRLSKAYIGKMHAIMAAHHH